jgi:peptidoglycan/LPS O-acetylase OafA/YrhL
MEQQSVYFPNLNSLRFIAVLIVIISHIEQFKNELNVSTASALSFVPGRLGVYLFFVLSGFLITYLLMAEYNKNKTIDVKKFYIRRILRIWPLYFLIILLALFIFPDVGILSLPNYPKEMIQHHVFIKLIFYVLFLPNLAVILFGDIPFAAITWSIGVEEQFYLAWPLLIKYVRNKFLLLCAIIILYPLIGLLLGYYSNYHWINILKRYWAQTPINCMAIGGMFSLICYRKGHLFMSVKRLLFTKSTQILTFLLLIILLAWHIDLPYFQNEIYSVLFGITIANLALNQKRIINLEFKWLSYLGKISYGLYLYHGIFIVVAIKFLTYWHLLNNICIYSLSIALTIAVSSISYRFFEKPFIARKVKFSAIISGLEPIEPTSKP